MHSLSSVVDGAGISGVQDLLLAVAGQGDIDIALRDLAAAVAVAVDASEQRSARGQGKHDHLYLASPTEFATRSCFAMSGEDNDLKASERSMTTHTRHWKPRASHGAALAWYVNTKRHCTRHTGACKDHLGHAVSDNSKSTARPFS